MRKSFTIVIRTGTGKMINWWVLTTGLIFIETHDFPKGVEGVGILTMIYFTYLYRIAKGVPLC